MLISKFDLYKREWLELVFDNRNKDYGAYELRQHYAGNMVRAMTITFFIVGLLCAASVLLLPATVRLRVIEVVNNPPFIAQPPPIAPNKEIKPPQAAKPIKAQPPAPAAATFKFVPPVVVVDNKAEQPVINDKITGAIGTQTTKGPITIDIPKEIPSATVGAPGPDVTVHTTAELDQMPEPNGGLTGWSKFLNKNLRFPPPAQEEGIGGRVMMSFVIEKDGSLSNIVVDKPAGHGFDEEALRVLKLAKAWKPGKQNGQPVRVKFYIPINFQVTE
jgi:protein TonB